MAEIILPPEENEETPQAPELNIDKPSGNSKVITIEFEAKKTNKVSTKDTNQQLYTTDTDAWFEFKETSLEGANGTYSVVFRNRHDGSIFQRTGDVVNGVAYYKIPEQEIRHAGKWRGQLVYTLENGNTTAREFDYDVKGHILDGKDVREIVVEDFETLMSQLRSMKDNAEQELAGLVNTANQNETDRQVLFDDLVEDIDELQANYQELLDTGVLQTNINTKLEALEEEYAPKLTEVTAQLAQKANEKDIVRKGYGTLDDFDEPTRAAIQGLEPGEVNAVLGSRNVQRENINYGSVNASRTDFIKTSTNLFDTEGFEPDAMLNEDTGEVETRDGFSTSKFIEIETHGEWTCLYATRIAWYDKGKNFMGISTNQTISEPKTVVIPSGALFLRITTESKHLDEVQLNVGNTLLPYEPYYEKLSDKIKPNDKISKLVSDVEAKGEALKIDTENKFKNEVLDFYNKPRYGAEVLSYPERRERLKEVADNYSDITLSNYNSDIEGVPAYLISEEQTVNIEPTRLHTYVALQYYAIDNNLDRFRFDLLTSDGSYVRFQFVNDDNRIKQGMNYLIFTKKDIAFTNGSVEGKDITQLRVSNTGGTAFKINKIHTYSIKSKVTIWFDDGHRTVYTAAKPIMDKYNFRGTHAMVGGWLNTRAGMMSFPDFEDMQRSGWEHCNHTYYHEKFGDVSIDRVELSIQKGLDYSQSMNFGKASYYLVNPGGQRSSNEDIEKKYSTVRRLGIGDNYFPIVDFHELRSKEPAWDTPATEVCQWIDEAISNDLWLNLLFHQIRPIDLPGTSRYPDEQFDLIMAYLKQKQDAGELEVLTCGQVISSM